MSQRLLTALGGTISAAIVGTLLSATPAQARDVDPAPPQTIVVTARASGPDHFNSNVDVAIPAGGNARVTSPTIDPAMTSATVTYTPLSAYEGFEKLALQLLQAPTPGKRLVFCLMSTVEAMNDSKAIAREFDNLDDFFAVEDTLFLVRMSYCIQVAKFVAEYQAANPRQAADPRSGKLGSTSCGQAPFAFKEKVTKTGGSYTLGAKGAALTVNKKKTRVKTRCKLVNGKIVMTVKPKKKGSTLRKAIGKNLNVAIAMPGDAVEGVSVNVAFKAK